MSTDRISSSAPADPSDEQLAQRACAGSVSSFVELLTRWDSRVYNFLLRRVQCPADAEDLTQDTFIRAWQRIDRYRPPTRFSTWLFTIAGRLAIDHHRARLTRVKGALRRDQLPASADSADEFEHFQTNRAQGARLWDLAAAVLDREQHAALWLRYAEDLAVKEIACVLGRTQVSVRVLLMRARRRLAERAALAQQDTLSAAGERGREDIPAPRPQGGVPCSAR